MAGGPAGSLADSFGTRASAAALRVLVHAERAPDPRDHQRQHIRDLR
ncbi:hypothetical protein [Saccharothrix syringae]|nr:hypothetical protein [Saccharothrix syringae]